MPCKGRQDNSPTAGIAGHIGWYVDISKTKVLFSQVLNKGIFLIVICLPKSIC
jgi:hypothetical protein